MYKFTASTAVAAFLSLTATAFAQDQEGLVNVSVDDNTVQVPVSVAANVCDIAVDVLSADFVGTEETACTIDQETAAANDLPGYEDKPGNGSGKQKGLVNVGVEGNTVQVPIGVAANVCGADVSALARDTTGSEENVCDISQETAAANNFPTLKDAVPADGATDTAEGAADTVDAADAVEGAPAATN